MLIGLNQFKRATLEPRKTGRPHTKRIGATSDALLRKDFFAPAVAVGDGRSIRFTISTAVVDRAMDMIDQAGWDLTSYRANPVVLWAHDSGQLPIGRCPDIGIENGNLCATVDFVRADMPIVGEFAETVRLMCLEGFISATSVGFRPIDFDVTEDPARGADDWFPGFDFKRQELLEFSIVPIPCNPEALIDPALRIDEGNPLAALLDPIAAAAQATRKAAQRRRLQAFRALG